MPSVKLERDVDAGIVGWAKDRWPDMIIRKLTTFGARGMAGDPDRLFFWKGKIMLMEMKSSKGLCTEIQLARQAQWRRAGATVVVVSDVSAGRSALAQHFDGRARRSIHVSIKP